MQTNRPFHMECHYQSHMKDYAKHIGYVFIQIIIRIYRRSDTGKFHMNESAVSNIRHKQYSIHSIWVSYFFLLWNKIDKCRQMTMSVTT